MRTQMKQKVKNCEICRKYQENKVIKDPLMSHDTGTTPWSKIGVDICYFDNRTILVTSDYYSNYITVRRLRNQGTDDVINELLGIFSTHGLPENIVCDNGPQFREKFLKFTKDHDINLVTSSPYLPQSNGKAENAVKTIKRIFKKCSTYYMYYLLYIFTLTFNSIIFILYIYIYIYIYIHNMIYTNK